MRVFLRSVRELHFLFCSRKAPSVVERFLLLGSTHECHRENAYYDYHLSLQPRGTASSWLTLPSTPCVFVFLVGGFIDRIDYAGKEKSTSRVASSADKDMLAITSGSTALLASLKDVTILDTGLDIQKTACDTSLLSGGLAKLQEIRGVLKVRPSLQISVPRMV